MSRPDYRVQSPTVNSTIEGPFTPPGISETAKARNLSNPDNGTVYFAFGYRVEYVWDEGLRSAPKAAPKGSNKKKAMWRSHTGDCYKVVTWEAQSLHNFPRIPHPDTSNPNEVLFRKSIFYEGPGEMPDGVKIWALQGTYIYELQTTIADTDYIQSGISPFSSDTSAVTRIRIADFDRYIGGPTVPPAAFPGGTISY